MSHSKAFTESIKNHLDKRASEDALFAETYKKENKSLEECCNYVLQCAKSGGSEGYTDDEVFAWAIHYYDEDGLKNINPTNAKVIVNHAVELTPDDIENAKKEALQKVIDEEKEKLRNKPAKSSKAKPTEEISLFD